MGAVAQVELRGAYGDLLHRVVERGLPELRRRLEAADATLPRFVWRELERFLACGDPERGFAWLVCEEGCEHHRLVPLSCKGRAFCPSCGGRRMAERSASWCDTVLPEVPFRQWVLTLPWRRRTLLAYRPHLARGVLDLALKHVFALLVARAEQQHGVTAPRTGAVSVEQRFDGGLRLNLHFHSLVPDGVFARGADGALAFHRVRPSATDLAELVERIATDAEDWLERQGVDDDGLDPDDAQAELVLASASGRHATGPRQGLPARRALSVEPEDERGPGRGVSCDGYGLHAETWVPAADRDGLLRLARYLLRPPLAKARLEERPDGQVVVHLRRAWRDGTRAFLFTPADLVERLAALVIRPRVHTTHFHGVFAARSAWRSEVVPDPLALRQRRDEEDAKALERLLRRRDRRRRWRSAWCPWSLLLERTFGAAGFRCPRCGGTLRLRAVVLGPPATSRVLAGLKKTARAPPQASSAP